MTKFSDTNSLPNKSKKAKEEKTMQDRKLQSQPSDIKEDSAEGTDTPMENGDSSTKPTDSSTSSEHTDSSSGDTSTDTTGSSRDGEETAAPTEGAVRASSETEEKKELLIIEDAGFNIKVVAPGLEPFDLQVSSMELVQEIYQVLIDKEETCHRTCFSLQLDGVTLDNFAELKTIDGLKEGAVIKQVEEPYSVREARIHLRHVRDLLKSVDPQDAYNGIDCNSLSFLGTFTNGNLADNRKNPKSDSVDCTPPDYIMPGSSKEHPLLPLHPDTPDQKGPQCLKILTSSAWNPPPCSRKMHGDLLYLYVVTLEDKRYHITGSTKGFYVNQSTNDDFNPKPASQKNMSHSLIDLLGNISGAFKKNFQVLLKRRAQKHPFERVATPYQVYSWLAPPMEHTLDAIRAEDAFSSRLGYEEHIPGQTRDWNEELQTTRELSRKTLPERLIRERAIFKVHSDFVVAATRGAMSVIDGNIMAINPGEDTRMQMFLWNNIFFSLGFDVKDHYKDFGGDYAAYAAPGNDLQGVRAYAGVDADGLYTLGTVVVDYRGYRVTAQSIIPGILEREQEQSVIYGSIDFGKTVVTSDKYRELLQKTAQQLKIRPHKVVNDKGEEVELYSSVECKGILGNDQRHYVLDLLRTFPPDINFLPTENEELSEELKSLGFPYPHRHKLVCLRQELIDAFTENRYVVFVKHAAYQFQHLRIKNMQEEHRKRLQENAEKEEKAKLESETGEAELENKEQEKEKENKENAADASKSDSKTEEKDNKKDEEEKNNDVKESENKEADVAKEVEAKVEDGELGTEEAKKLVDAMTTTAATYEESSKEIVQSAAKAISSLSDTEFCVAFNPDVFQPHVNHANPEGDMLKREKQMVKDAAEFLVLHQIPSFIRDCLEHTSSPIDGHTLSEALHHNGINIRYLGKVAEMVSRQPSLCYLYTICVAELVSRVAKHLFKTYMQGVEMMSLSASMSHFLNCFLGSYPTPHTQVAADELQRAKRRNKKKIKGAIHLSNDNVEWASETPKSLWKKINEEAKEYFKFTLECDSIDTATEKYGFHKMSLLRAICKKVGLQVQLRDYQLDSKTRQPFHEDDIMNVFPTVKHIHPKASDAYHVFTSGQNKIQQGLLRDGYEHISEALNLLNNVYGAMHPEIAACARLLARLNYIMGDYPEALMFQQRAVLMSERVLGIDHPNTITEYAHLALYSFANNQISTALKLMYRARYLALLCHGENHPEVALFDSNIGLILHAVGEFDLSLRFLQKALEHNTKFFGARSLKVAMNYHLVARAFSCKGDFRTALQNEKEAYSIYKQLLGEEHDRTKESTECLKHLTQQAVKFQKTMNQLSRGEKLSSLPPLQIQTPSLANVLDTLNLINGIVFLHISQEDIEKFREEMLRRQQQQSGGGSGGEGKVVLREIKDNPVDGDSKTNGENKVTKNSPRGDADQNGSVKKDKGFIAEPADR